MAEIPNEVSAVLASDVASTILGLYDQMEVLMPFLLALTTEQRKALPKFGDSALGFVNGNLQMVQQDDSYLPRNFSVEEMQKDVTLLNQLANIRNRHLRFSQKLIDTYRVVGSEAYKASLISYKSAKENGPADLAPVIQQLGLQFAYATGSKSEGEGEEDGADTAAGNASGSGSASGTASA